MSKNVDLSKPLSDEDREYLKQRARHYDIEENDRVHKKGKFVEAKKGDDPDLVFAATNTVPTPPIEPGSAADNPPRFVGNRPYGVDRAVWAGSTGLSEQEAYAATAGEPHESVDAKEQEAPEDVTDPKDAEYKTPEELAAEADGDEGEAVAPEDLSVDELKAELKSRGLKVSGNHDDLAARLREYLEAED